MSETIEKKIILFKDAVMAFKENENIVERLRRSGVEKSTSIEMAYELQAGEYTRNFDDLQLRRNLAIHQIIDKYISLGNVDSVGVLGVGEAKNWIGYQGKINKFIGLELSFSRLAFAHINLSKVKGIRDFKLIKGDASQTVFQNNAVDMCITQHSIEPNGNVQGAVMLEKVISSASRYILLFEPDFSTATPKMKERMLRHDYVRNIEESVQKNTSVVVLEKFIMDIHAGEDNLTTCWVLEKKVIQEATTKLACPYTGCELREINNFLYSPETGLAYPWVGNWWCINKSDAVFVGLADQEY